MHQIKVGDRTSSKIAPVCAEISSKKIWKIGDRIGTPNHPGTVIKATKNKISIAWHNGHSADYTPKQIENYGYQFLEEVAECSDSLTYAAVQGQDSHLLGLCVEDLSLLDSQKSTNGVTQSSRRDTQEYITTEMYTALDMGKDSSLKTSTSSQPAPRANHLAKKERGKVQQTSETVSPQCCSVSKDLSPSIQLSKTCQDSLIAPTVQVKVEKCIVTTLQPNSQQPDTISKGRSFPVAALEVPSLASDYCWLPSPTGLSSRSSRPPGLNKLESFLKKNGLINKGEVLNPDILAEWLAIPQSFLDPSELRTAAQLLADSERQLAMDLTPELPVSHSVESFTTNQSQSKTVPENFLEETEEDTKQLPSPKRKQRKGCLYKYLENKKLKDGSIASYPRVIGETRNPNNPKHWRWGFNWEEKVDGEWKGRSIGSVPVGAIALIQSMQNQGVSLEEIINFIRRSKSKK